MDTTQQLPQVEVKKTNFWNGWDLKTILLYVGVGINIGLNMGRFDTLESNQDNMRTYIHEKVTSIENTILKLITDGVANGKDIDRAKDDIKELQNKGRGK